jgi:cobaltochelatase CobS
MSDLASLVDLPLVPDARIRVADVFGFETSLEVFGFSQGTSHVPRLDPTYRFDPATTMSILAGFAANRRVIVYGLHGTGKSTHIEQVAARLNWPCIRVNLDSHISRIDLIGKDAIVLKDGKQVTEFREGMLPWALQHPIALVFDEYDAGRPDVMFVIQRVLEAEGRMTLLDQNRVLDPHPSFRLFATANTIGLGDPSGLYHGTQQLNQAQLDRWSVVTRLDYLPHEVEVEIVAARCPALDTTEGRSLISRMVRLAELSRTGFQAGDVSTLMSPRTVMTWADNHLLFRNLAFAYFVSFLNKCDETEWAVFAEYYQRCIGRPLPPTAQAALKD